MIYEGDSRIEDAVALDRLIGEIRSGFIAQIGEATADAAAVERLTIAFDRGIARIMEQQHRTMIGWLRSILEEWSASTDPLRG